jgi:hypothetical protein
MRPVMTIAIHIGYTDGFLSRELSLPGGLRWVHRLPTSGGRLAGSCSEADHIGLILMATAGYDPHEAIGLWERMEAGQRGAGPPEFLSTHHSGATRIKQIQQWLLEALQYYRGPGRP